MPEAVIVAAARSPIGRALKGSLRTMRPDDLAAAMIRAALNQVPALDPHTIDDIMLGCAQPAASRATVWPASWPRCSALTTCRAP